MTLLRRIHETMCTRSLQGWKRYIHTSRDYHTTNNTRDMVSYNLPRVQIATSKNQTCQVLSVSTTPSDDSSKTKSPAGMGSVSSFFQVLHFPFFLVLSLPLPLSLSAFAFAFLTALSSSLSWQVPVNSKISGASAGGSPWGKISPRGIFSFKWFLLRIWNTSSCFPPLLASRNSFSPAYLGTGKGPKWQTVSESK